MKPQAIKLLVPITAEKIAASTTTVSRIQTPHATSQKLEGAEITLERLGRLSNTLHKD